MQLINEMIAKLSVNDPEHFWVYIAGIPYFCLALKNLLILVVATLLISKNNRKDLWLIIWCYLIFTALKGLLWISYCVHNQSVVVSSLFASIDVLLTNVPLAIIIILILIWSKPSYCNYIIGKRAISKQIMVGIATGIVLLVVTSFLNLSASFNTKVVIFSDVTIKTLWITIIAFVVIMPFVEETLFRGFIFNSMRTHRNILFSSITSSFAFALFNNGCNIQNGLVLLFFLLGVALSFLMVHYKNLMVCIVAHAAFNLSLILLSFFG